MVCLVDTKQIESVLKDVFFNNSISIRVFDIFKDEVSEYAYENENYNISNTSNFTDYIEQIKAKVDSEHISGVMNLLSIPKIKELIHDGKNYASYEYKSIDGSMHRLYSAIISVNETEMILNIDQILSNTVTTKGNDEKYNYNWKLWKISKIKWSNNEN